MSIRVRNLPHTYKEAKRLLGKNVLRNIGSTNRYWRDDPRTGPQGHLVYDEKYIYIKLYDTVIVKFYPDGRIWLNCGRFPTYTTMRWINNVLSRSVLNENYYGVTGYLGGVGREYIEYPIAFTSETKWWHKEYRMVYYGNGNKYGKVLPYMIRRKANG